MFNPIKNLITYIQKNASGSAIFGGTPAVADGEEAEEVNTSTEVGEKMKKASTVGLAAMAESAQQPKTHEFNKAVKIVPVTTTTTMADNFDEDDIELQIKSSIMIRKPSGEAVVASGSAKIAELKEAIIVPSSSSPLHDHNQNHALDDELEDFRYEPPMPSIGLDDFCSVDSVEPIADEEDRAEEFNTEEEDVEEPFLDVTEEIEAFAGREIIVLSEAELNTSIASDALSEDPLAIDDFTQTSTRESVLLNPLDSSASTNDEASTSADIVWINIDDLKRNPITPKLEKDSTAASTLQTQATKVSKDKAENGSVQDEQAEELRSDGSDSGLGSETSLLQTTVTSSADTSQAHSAAATPTKAPTHEQVKTETAHVQANLAPVVSSNSSKLASKTPLRSNLKRRLDVADDDVLDETNTSMAIASSAQQKKLKRSINFDNVQVYYFPRQQGFGCVPSAGGCTLGMAAHHVAFKTLTLAEHAAELRRAHRMQLQEINPRGSSSDESEESEEDYLSEGSGSDLDAESSGFLQPVSPKQRRALLKAAGVRKIDASEKAECRDIRNSREVCGCTCRDFCDPDTCACSQAGIKCQVDRAMFPCGCSRDACGNTVGRVEFNPARVRTHFIHTIMRLEMENRQQQNPPLCGGYGMSASSSSTSTQSASPHGMSGNYYGMQTPSNYSSGYASPAYTTDPAASYYQQPSAHYASVLPTPDLLQTTAAQYQMDSLDSGLFSGTGTPSYGELMPAYGSVCTPAASASSVYPNISYSTVTSGLQTQVSSYSSYHHHQSSTNYLPPNHTSATPSTYSSCAVPSVPPYGTATTTAAGIHYQGDSGVALETTSCTSLEGAGSSFINLNAPISSSSRLSQINDLLQHNRNTTAALVAVSQCPSSGASATLSSVSAAATASIDTPPIEDANKSCLAFEELSPPLNPTPIVAVREHCAATKLAPTEPPPNNIGDGDGDGGDGDACNAETTIIPAAIKVAIN